MDFDNYILFKNQINSFIEKYPHFKVIKVNGLERLKGIVDITNSKKEVVQSFSIEIAYRLGFPYRFPILYEVGGEIPPIDDWHKYKDNSCCITVYPDEIIKCKDSIDIMSFLEMHAIPYLANHHYRVKTGKYLNGEYAHGIEGLKQFYATFFKTEDISKWLFYFQKFMNENYYFDKSNKSFSRRIESYSGSANPIFNEMLILGYKQIVEHFNLILNYIEK